MYVTEFLLRNIQSMLQSFSCCSASWRHKYNAQILCGIEWLFSYIQNNPSTLYVHIKYILRTASNYHSRPVNVTNDNWLNKYTHNIVRYLITTLFIAIIRIWWSKSMWATYITCNKVCWCCQNQYMLIKVNLASIFLIYYKYVNMDNISSCDFPQDSSH